MSFPYTSLCISLLVQGKSGHSQRPSLSMSLFPFSSSHRALLTPACQLNPILAEKGCNLTLEKWNKEANTESEPGWCTELRKGPDMKGLENKLEETWRIYNPSQVHWKKIPPEWEMEPSWHRAASGSILCWLPAEVWTLGSWCSSHFLPEQYFSQTGAWSSGSEPVRIWLRCSSSFLKSLRHSQNWEPQVQVLYHLYKLPDPHWITPLNCC